MDVQAGIGMTVAVAAVGMRPAHDARIPQEVLMAR
jgi:hypothetical protein